jgi:4,5-DOPA dioxygenase extradiol
MVAPTGIRQPAAFFGHGSPMNAIQRTRNSEAWAAFGRRFFAADRAPAAILSLSAHWYGPGTAVTASRAPQTLHDFGSFPQALFEVQYPAAGDPALARRIADLLAPLPVELDTDWGLDHGTWSVLVHAAPAANIPVLQLRIDASKPPAWHYELGKKLAALRDENVAIMGSGDTVHNLRMMDWHNADAAFDWAQRFDEKFLDCLRNGDHAPLIDYVNLTPEALQAVPTPEHYLPLLYVLGAQQPDDELLIVNEGIDHGSISMLAFAFA